DVLVRLNNITDPSMIFPGQVLLIPAPSPTGLEGIWFYVNDPAAWQSLQNNYRQIDVLAPFWYPITETGEVVNGSNPQVLNFTRQNGIPIYGLIHNFDGSKFDRELIDNVLSSPQLRTNLVNNIQRLVGEQRLAGVNIDFEFISPENRRNLNLFMRELYNRLHPAGYAVTISVFAKESDNPTNILNGVYDYSTLANYSDQIVILTQDEHYMDFPDPGPIASIPWVRRVLNYAVTRIPSRKIKMGIPVYGYNWPEGERGTLVSYQDVENLAETFNGEFGFDTTSMAPYLTYMDNSESHIVWFENAISFAIKLELAQEYNLGGFAVWRLGMEDPDVWEVLASE
ncbi:MAG: glycosyl hydrolase family 18 protein, partial [Desulfitobacteriaceae bacterium]|nr:glycosyl hydrolase family 18 protein [Desulfitobacteriaceae bacterium]